MNIKKIIFGILLFTFFSGVAQRGSHQKIKAYKTAYITEALDLTVNEAEKFWPIYNSYDKKLHEIKVIKTKQLFKKIREAGSIDELSDGEADKILNDFLAIDTKIGEIKENLKKDLSGIISSKKMIKLISAEKNFNRELLKRFRQRAGNEKRN